MVPTRGFNAFDLFVGPEPLEPAGLEPSVTKENSNALRGTAGRPYSQADESWVVPMLVHAFAEDPVATHLFPTPEIRTRGMAHVFKMALRSASRLGAIDVIPPNQAAAIWLRPEHLKPGLVQMLLAGALATPFLVGWQATHRMLRYERFVEEQRFQLMGGRPHWYLFAIGIQPGHQGRGLGSMLLATGRQRAATGGFPCYLETSNERNLAFYQKNGFTVIDRRTIPGAQLSVWSLASENSRCCG